MKSSFSTPSRWTRRAGPFGLTVLVLACSATVPPEDANVADSGGPSEAPLQFVLDPSRHPALSDQTYGAAIADLDSDGDLDVVLAVDGPSLQVLFNDGTGTFTDASGESGVSAVSARGTSGVVVVDVDGDGAVDLFVTRRYNTNRLLLGDGKGHFVAAGDAWGLTSKAVYEGASFGDLDGDGDLDVYIAVSRDPARDGDRLEEGENGAPNVALRNEGDHFVDWTADTGLAGAPRGESFGSVIFDVDGDRLPDVLVVNDFRPDQFFRNVGDGHFVEEAAWLDPSNTGLMGLDVGDIDLDGTLDIYSTNWGFDHVKLQQRGTPRFPDRASAAFAGGPDPSGGITGWGCALVDVDNDTDLDVLATAAFADSAGELRDGRLTLIENELSAAGGLRLTDRSEESGPPLKAYVNGYGLSVGDLDGDGDQDAVVGVVRRAAHFSDPPNTLHESLLLWNVGARASQNRSLSLDLRMSGANTRAVGAVVRVTVGGVVQTRVVLAGSSYLSSVGPRLHFGLGGAQAAERVEIVWPDGSQSAAADVPAGVHQVARP